MCALLGKGLEMDLTFTMLGVSWGTPPKHTCARARVYTHTHKYTQKLVHLQIPPICLPWGFETPIPLEVGTVCPIQNSGALIAKRLKVTGPQTQKVEIHATFVTHPSLTLREGRRAPRGRDAERCYLRI